MSLSIPVAEIVKNSEKGLLSKKSTWSRIFVEEFAKIINGYPFESKNFSKEEGTPLIRIRDIKDSSTDTKYKGDYPKEYLVYEGDILIGMDGDFDLGIWKGEPALLNQRVCKIVVDETKFRKKLFCYLMPGYLNAIHKATSAVTVKHLSSRDVAKTPLPYPSLEEQDLMIEEIETQFTRLEAAARSIIEVKTKLQVYRKSVLKAAFFGEQKKLSEIVSKNKHALKRGPFGGSLKKEIFVPKGYKVYEQKNAIQNDFEIGKYFINKDKFDNMQEFKVKPGDFIVSCSGTIGKIAEIPKEAPEGIINQALLKITLDNTIVLNQYFRYLFESEYVQKHLTNISRGVAIKNVPPMKDMKNISFPIPSIEEQKIIIQDIESKFSIIDKLEVTVDASLDKAEQLKKSILKSAFEGKLVKGEL